MTFEASLPTISTMAFVPLNGYIDSMYVFPLFCIILAATIRLKSNVFLLLNVPKGVKLPYVLPGNLLVGSAIELTKNSILFTQKYHKRHGKVFQTKIGPDTVVFVNDVHFAASMARKPNLFSFNEYFLKKAAKIFCFQATDDTIKRMHRWANKYISKGENLELVTRRFSLYFNAPIQAKVELMKKGTTTVNLYDFVSRHVFQAALRAIYGNYDSSLEQNQIYDKMVLFDSWVTIIGSGFCPEFLLREPRSAQSFVANYLANALKPEQMPEMTLEMEKMTQVPNIVMMFTLAWAMNANSMPTLFWMMLFILRDENLRTKVTDEIHQVLKQQLGWETDASTELPVISTDCVKGMHLLKAVLWETLRRRSSINLNREVTEDTVIEVGGEKYFVQKGHIINATNPHHDVTVFPEPEKFDVQRFLEGTKHHDSNGKVISLPIQAFGHGPSMCLGRHFAHMEAAVTIATLLLAFDWEPVDPMASEPPPNYEYYMFGCMPLDPKFMNHPSVQYNIKVKDQFVKNLE